MIVPIFFGRHTLLARKKVTIIKTVLQWKTRIRSLIFKSFGYQTILKGAREWSTKQFVMK